MAKRTDILILLLRIPTASLMELMAWDATDQLELINVPLLLIAGSKADSLYMSQDAFKKATGTSNKELFLIPGATHIQTYYVPEYVDIAVNKLQQFYGNIFNQFVNMSKSQ